MKYWIATALLLGALPAAAQQTRCDNNARPRPDLGISIACENCSVGDYNRPSSWSFSAEPRISAVISGGAAAGVLEAGDEIVRVNGYTITSAQGAAAFGSPAIGKPMVLTIRRNGSLRPVTVTPVARCPEDIKATAIVSGASEAAAASYVRAAQAATTPAGWLGIAFDCTDCSVQRTRPGVSEWRFSGPPRIYSVETSSPAYTAGLRRGDEVTHIDGIAITEPEGGRRFGSIRPGQSLRIGYRRDGSGYSTTVKVGERPAATITAYTAARNDPERELRQLIEQQQRIEERARALASSSERRLSESLAQRLRSHADESASRMEQLQSQLRNEQNEARKRALEAQIRELRENTTRHQQQLLNELVVKQQQETERLQELQRELSRSGGRVALVPSAGTGGRYTVAPSAPASSVLRYSGSLGGTAIEVRGPTPVVVDQKGDTITITIGSSTVKVTQDRK